jgi:hypothetical protein
LSTPPAPPGRVVGQSLHRRLARLHRLLAVAALGFASGLPLALTGQAMQAWLTMDGLAIADIGFLTLVGLPYTFKFIWAPLMDRFDLFGSLAAARLDGAHATGAGGGVVGPGRHLAARIAARLRAAGVDGGLPVGVAGHRGGRLPHRRAAWPPSAAWARRWR